MRSPETSGRQEEVRVKEHSSSEKRKYSRVDVNFVVSYRIKEEYDNSDLTQTKNISQGGILLTTNRKFDKGTRLAMVIRLPFLARKIELDGEVVDSKVVVKNLIYETRIKFFNLGETLLRDLGNFVDRSKKV